jgi:hypothetical protein
VTALMQAKRNCDAMAIACPGSRPAVLCVHTSLCGHAFQPDVNALQVLATPHLGAPGTRTTSVTRHSNKGVSSREEQRQVRVAGKDGCFVS